MLKETVVLCVTGTGCGWNGMDLYQSVLNDPKGCLCGCSGQPTGKSSKWLFLPVYHRGAAFIASGVLERFQCTHAGNERWTDRL